VHSAAAARLASSGCCAQARKLGEPQQGQEFWSTTFALRHLATDAVVGDLADVEAADADSSAAAARRRHRAGGVRVV
jgi:hypothetical protein